MSPRCIGALAVALLGLGLGAGRIGFDLAVVEECGRYSTADDDECAAYGDGIVVIEYTAGGFRTACEAVGRTIAVVRRNVDVRPRGEAGYVYDAC